MVDYDSTGRRRLTVRDAAGVKWTLRASPSGTLGAIGSSRPVSD